MFIFFFFICSAVMSSLNSLLKARAYTQKAQRVHRVLHLEGRRELRAHTAGRLIERGVKAEWISSQIVRSELQSDLHLRSDSTGYSTFMRCSPYIILTKPMGLDCATTSQRAPEKKRSKGTSGSAWVSALHIERYWGTPRGLRYFETKVKH